MSFLPTGWGRVLLALILLTVVRSAVAEESVPRSRETLILAHDMPWFEAKPVSSRWGWHWTMNARNPERITAGQREIASHYHPLIGPYDSSDPDVLEYHLLTMKLAGIDGVIVDWYGLTDFRDYAVLHRNTTRLLETAERLRMKFVICYEDQTVPALVEGGRIRSSERVSHVAAEIRWLGKFWFQSPSYVALDGKPVLLSFGQSGLSNAEWSQCLEQSETPVTYFSQHHRRTAAVGAFDWPIPTEPVPALERFRHASRDWPRSIPVAYPRFVDFYAEAKVSASHGRIEDDRGESFRSMLEHALQSRPPVIQLATWNDWGEGTQIEPSVEFGYRDLETVQVLRRKHVDPGFTLEAGDLRLPGELLKRRREMSDSDSQQRLDAVARWLAEGRITEARATLKP